VHPTTVNVGGSAGDRDGFQYMLSCPCGVRLTGATEDEIVERSFEHLREHHPELATAYEPEHILLMAVRRPT
jgi:hypothetical protein